MPLLFHHRVVERQVAALCGRHCLNSLLQGPYFSDFDLAEIAHRLDDSERALMLAEGADTADAIRFIAEDSGNVDEAGNFSVSVRACWPVQFHRRFSASHPCRMVSGT